MLKFKIHGIKETKKYFKDLEKKLQSQDKFYDETVPKIMKNAFTEVFRNEGQTKTTQKWHPLAASTIAARKRKSRKRIKILWDTGQMRDSLVKDSEQRTSGNKFEIWSSDPRNILRFHETGTRWMPERSVMWRAAKVAEPKLVRAKKKEIREIISNGP